MPKCVVFTDFVDLQPISSIDQKDFKEIQDWMTADPGKNSVTVRLKATHSGRITLNNSMYLPDKMRTGVSSWLSPYEKPILLHHPERQSLFSGPASAKDRDPIGRVVEAKYVDLSQQIPRVDSLQDDHNFNMFKQLTDGQLSFEDACNIATMLLIDNEALMRDPAYEGLGYIELTASISDPEAVRKVIDRRYLTGSISASTNKAVCSICKRDWANDDEVCEHRPGQEYEGKQCVLIAGDLSYSEYSFVNSPADVFSGIIEVNNSAEPKYFIQNRSVVPEDRVVSGPFSLQEATGFFNKKFSIFDLFIEKRDNSTKQEESTVLVPIEQKVEDQVLEGPPEPPKIEDAITPQPIESVQPSADVQDAELVNEPEDKIKAFWGSEYNELVEDDPSGPEYAEMMALCVLEASDSEKEELEKAIRDAKLSAKKRKSLPSSSFCGPDRSFPVPDCAHYTAAKRMIGRYKGTGNKDTISSCIERKGRKLGCSGAKSEDSEGGDLLNKIQELVEQVRPAQETLDNLRDEIQGLQDDNQMLQDAMAELIKELNDTRKQRLVLLTCLTTKETNISKVSESLKDKTSDEIKEGLNKLETSLSDEFLCDIIVPNGLKNLEPEGVVEDPTLSISDSPQRSEVLEKKKMQAILDKAREIETFNGVQAAREFLEIQLKKQSKNSSNEE